MGFHRVFIDPGEFADGRVVVRGADALHILRVLRMSEGDQFVALDGRGGAWVAEIESHSRPVAGREASLIGRIVAEACLAPEPSCKVTLYQSIPRGDKMEFIIQKCTEVGVHSIVPFVSERTVVRLGERSGARVDRWRRIAREAAEQCGRLVVPAVSDVCRLDDIQPAPDSRLLVLWEASAGPRLLDALSAASGTDGGGLSGTHDLRVGIVVGPEGGLSEAEVDTLRERGGVAVSLGPRILRTETAGMIAAALVLCRSGDLG